AQIMLWDSRYTTEIDYSLYLDGESPDGFNIPDGYVFKTETIFNIVVKCLEKNQIIIDIMDAMFANENIDPSTVQYFLLLNGAGDQPSDDNTAEIKKNITLEEVDNLSKKGYELTLKDLEGYNYIDTGNGILSGINREYFIDEEYSLVVIQEENESKPRSIVLYSNRGFAVDIRSSEYQDFFEKPILYLITEPADTDHNEYNVILANGSLYGGPMEKGFFYNLVDSPYFTEDTPKAVRGIAKKDLKVNDDLLDFIKAVCKEVAENSEQTELVECTGYKITSERERLFIVNDGKAYAIADFGKTFRIINNKNAQALIEKLIDTGYSETVSKIQGSTISGDANGDGQVSMADAVLIMQYISNPDKYGENGTDKNHITEQGKKNADIAGENDGVTNADALAIQKKLLKLD
ncbi:MAG: dockerin type I repeat-containing protein, partial [Ruminococcus sp.]|nr:dockerin type I repeat-containing protein [Ruminococcus sp.]